MARQNLNGSDALNAIYQKSNANFIELYAATGMGTTPLVAALNDLEDVELSIPVQQGELLTYNIAIEKWINQAPYDYQPEIDLATRKIKRNYIMMAMGGL